MQILRDCQPTHWAGRPAVCFSVPVGPSRPSRPPSFEPAVVPLKLVTWLQWLKTSLMHHGCVAQ